MESLRLNCGHFQKDGANFSQIQFSGNASNSEKKEKLANVS